jgi:U2 small nuclear ribonucleoprotein A'
MAWHGMQDREAADKQFGESAAAAASNTFEPGEGLDQQQQHENGDADMADGEGAGAAVAGEAAEGAAGGGVPVKATAVSKPTPEQLTAIQAAIANAATLEEVQRLEQALQGGTLPSEFQFSEGGKEGGGGSGSVEAAAAAGAAAMDEG